jgi:parvulin-like peptidyl-prolyl isomerase
MRSSSRSRSRALIGVAVVVVAFLASCSSTPAPDVAATVGGATITKDEVARTAAVFTAVAAIQQQSCGQSEGPTDTAQAACNRASLSSLIQFRLADAYAATAGITVPDAKVNETYASFEQSVGAEALTAQLQANGVAVEDVKALVRSSLVQQEVATAVVAERLTDAELRKRYEAAIGDYTTLHFDHIVVQTEAEAQRIHDEVTAPGFTLKDFQALAKQVSTDQTAKDNGGELSVPASQLLPEFSQAAAALSPGEISEPVQSQAGWHVIWKISEEVTPFAQAKATILKGAQQDEFGAWMREQAADGVDVDPSFGRFDGQQLVVVRVASTDPSATVTPSGAVNGVPSSSP